MSIARKVDDWLFDNRYFGFQAILTKKFQEFTGRTCFWLAKWSVFTWMVCHVLSFIHSGFEAVSGMIAVGVMVITPIFWIKAEYSEKSFLNTPAGSVGANPERVHELLIILRVLCALASVGNLPFLMLAPAFGGVQIIFWTAGLYFFACTPLPPSKSTVRKWYEKALTKVNDALSPKPEPVPIEN